MQLHDCDVCMIKKGLSLARWIFQRLVRFSYPTATCTRTLRRISVDTSVVIHSQVNSICMGHMTSMPIDMYELVLRTSQTYFTGHMTCTCTYIQCIYSDYHNYVCCVFRV